MIIILILQSLTAIADSIQTEELDSQLFSIVHDHDDSKKLDNLSDLGIDSQMAFNEDCHQCGHCQSLSYFFISNIDFKFFHPTSKTIRKRYTSQFLTQVITPNLRPPII